MPPPGLRGSGMAAVTEASRSRILQLASLTILRGRHAHIPERHVPPAVIGLLLVRWLVLDADAESCEKSQPERQHLVGRDPAACQRRCALDPFQLRAA